MKLGTRVLGLFLWQCALGIYAKAVANDIDIFHGDLATFECYSVERSLSSSMDPNGCITTNIVFTYFNGGAGTGFPLQEYFTVQADALHDCIDTNIKDTCLVYVDGHGMCSGCSYHDDMLTLDDCMNLPGVFAPGRHNVSFYDNTNSCDGHCETDFFPLARDDTRCSHPSLGLNETIHPSGTQAPTAIDTLYNETSHPSGTDTPSSLNITVAPSDGEFTLIPHTDMPSSTTIEPSSYSSQNATVGPSGERSTDMPVMTVHPSGTDKPSMDPTLITSNVPTMSPSDEDAQTGAPTESGTWTNSPSGTGTAWFPTASPSIPSSVETLSPSNGGSAGSSTASPSVPSSVGTPSPSNGSSTASPTASPSNGGSAGSSTASPSGGSSPQQTPCPTNGGSAGSSTASPSPVSSPQQTARPSSVGSGLGSSLSPRTGAPSSSNCLDDWANGVAEAGKCYAVDRFLCAEQKSNGCTTISALYHYYNDDMEHGPKSYYHITVHSAFGCSSSPSNPPPSPDNPHPEMPRDGCSVHVQGHKCRDCINNRDEDLLVDCSNLGFAFDPTIQHLSLRNDGGHLSISETEEMCNFGSAGNS